ncbi:MAG: L-seryl-tRNA(Sec) selenium transferase [Chloroflexi bacterium]|nr:L-seryl-tRNA(Sec) selenium transferase [Chloroflexota bacterium]
MPTLRDLPAVDQLLQLPGSSQLMERFGRPLTLQAIRASLDDLRFQLKEHKLPSVPSNDQILVKTESLLVEWTKSTLVPVINASGVILHTNLGRAPLSKAALQAMAEASRGFSNLEFDIESGRRGSRLIHAESLLRRLTGAEAAIVVNNNASAVLLVLSALASKKRVIISRSQLVEIGGGFRVPEVMKQSGAKLVEVGATNKVHLSDYEEALIEPAALVMRAHRSNFKLVGFTDEPELKSIVVLAHGFGVPVVDDLGSGALVDTAKYGLAHEPTVQESLAAGADLVCFSGDKLLGGPQAGIILGGADLLAKIKKHPLARAVRADKTCLAGLITTLLHYLKDEAEREIPILKMISMRPEQVKGRAEAWAAQLGQGDVVQGESTVGGGSLPGESMPTWLLALDVKSPDKFLKSLRKAETPIIARTAANRILLDPRTVLIDEENMMLECLKKELYEND